MSTEQAVQLLETAINELKADEESAVETIKRALSVLDVDLGDDVIMIESAVSKEESRHLELHKLIINSMTEGVVVRSPQGEYIQELTNPAARQFLDNFSVLNQIQVPIEDGIWIEVGEHVLSVTMTHMILENQDGNLGDIFVLRDVTSEAAGLRINDYSLMGIRYEFLTPLTSIRGYAEIMRESLIENETKYTTEEQIKFLTNIIRYAKRLYLMVLAEIDLASLNQELDGLRLKFASQQPGQRASHLDEVNLKKLVQKVVDESHHAKKSAINLQFEHDRPAVHVLADEFWLERVVKALLENIYVYSADDTHLQVGLDVQVDRAGVRITAPGMDISEEDKTKIFTPFYLGIPEDSEGNLVEMRGIGLGLHVAKTIAELHHGDLVLTDNEVGKGSTFTLYLPLAE